MLKHMLKHRFSICSGDAQAMHERTQLTNATNERIQDLTGKSNVGTVTPLVDNRVFAMVKQVIHRRFGVAHGR